MARSAGHRSARHFQKPSAASRRETRRRLRGRTRDTPAGGNRRRHRRLAFRGDLDHVLDRAHVAQHVVEHAGIQREVHVAGDARDLGAIGLEHHDGGITRNAKLIAQLLRVGQIAIEIHRDEQFRLLDEVRTIEHRRLELLARRAPLRAPVQQHGFVRRLAEANAALTSPSNQAIPGASACTLARLLAAGFASQAAPKRHHRARRRRARTRRSQPWPPHGCSRIETTYRRDAFVMILARR